MLHTIRDHAEVGELKVLDIFQRPVEAFEDRERVD
jgi:hypothetical protein